VAADALRVATERGGSPQAAAAQLARELDIAIRELGRTVQRP
jgi:hypothetical protein